MSLFVFHVMDLIHPKGPVYVQFRKNKTLYTMIKECKECLAVNCWALLSYYTGT